MPNDVVLTAYDPIVAAVMIGCAILGEGIRRTSHETHEMILNDPRQWGASFFRLRMQQSILRARIDDVDSRALPIGWSA